ncbi:MAG: chromosome segregation protein SMC [Lachnospiraceae bacterium]|nr:chromosome segregation protein SMC [Lachnospiraceae bacterium]
MYLKHLDLQGFKSFPDKIKLDFDNGITAVVGPNGSGKSNISDSIKWVLGEQRVKSLRGDKMEDIIFAGTQMRKPLGFAEVSLTLDNSDGKIPVDYSEVKVTRTVFRSGESKYAINGTQCRLKDIHELFMDTGIGREGYSIIGQGKIDEILSSKGEDRRKLFEEAAGIVKYKNRRNETLDKLEKEQRNLERVQDIINELESNVEPLRKESEKAKKYIALKEELKSLEITRFYNYVTKLDENLDKLEEAYRIMTDDSNMKDERIKEIREAARLLKEEIEALDNEIALKNSELVDIKAEEEKAEGAINLCVSQILNYDSNIERIKSDISQAKLDVNSLTGSLLELGSEKSALLKVIDEKNADLKNKEAEYNTVESLMSVNEEHIEEFKSEILEEMKNISDAENNKMRLEALNEQFMLRLEQINAEKEQAESRYEAANVHKEAVKLKLSESDEKIEALNEENKAITEKADAISVKLSKIKADLEAKNRELGEKISRYSVLSEMEKDYEGFYKSVKSILKLRDTRFKGVCGAVGELIKVDKKYETAIETALGAGMQNIVTVDEDEAKNAINYLKANNLGRASFLPLSVIKGKTFGNEKGELSGAEGFIGIASELVKFDKKYKSIIDNLLGKVVIMENIDHAVRLSRKAGYKYRIVTLEGDVIAPGGMMTGGSVSKKSTSFFARGREIGELKDMVLKLKSDIGKLTAKGDELDEELVLLKCNETTNLEKIQEIRVSVASLRQEYTQSEETLAELGEKKESLEKEAALLTKQIDSATEDIEYYKDEIESTREDIKELEDRLSVFKGTTETGKAEREKLLGDLTAIKVDISALKEKKTAIEENISRIEGEIELKNDSLSAFDENIAAFEKLKAEKEEEKDAFNAELDKAEAKFALCSGEIEALNDKKKIKTGETKDFEDEQQDALESSSLLKNDIFKTETKIERLKEDKQKIIDEIWEEYEITYQMAEGLRDLTLTNTEADKGVKGLKGQIKELGHVNVNAIEQYRETKERYEFLTSQRDDILSAEEKLMVMVNDLTELMKKQFAEQFKVISENFNVVFKEMFGGGKAYLKLSDESNVLDSGIEIIAQPPGKNLQNMMLLSGGERALTAIAILFSILKMKPSPFCVLDEIEAALDDANVNRFAQYLKRFADDTQFIVITHRKGTMESADTMYGVTMQEKGVSKIISVKFEDAKKDAI